MTNIAAFLDSCKKEPSARPAGGVTPEGQHNDSQFPKQDAPLQRNGNTLP
jgi:hypothetical protein